MVDQRVLELDPARVALFDATHVTREPDEFPNPERDLPHLLSEAKEAMNDYPNDLPYADEYRTALDDRDVEAAFEALAHIAAFLEEYSPDKGNYVFHYPYEALDRIQDDYRDFYE